MSNAVLVADIGGTNARFALADRQDGQINISDPQTFRAEDFETIRDAANAYLESVMATPTAASFAVAGPVREEVINFTNSHWVLDKSAIKEGLELDQFHVVNDFYALAAGVPFLRDEDCITVKDGIADQDAPQLVVGPGTGLGQALIVPLGDKRKVVATEGGHVSFAPRTDEEIAVLQFIGREHPRVSVERLLSGRGLVNIHRALCAVADVPRVSLRPDEITMAAMDQSLPIATQSVDMFCSILGRVIGDAVLGTGALGGVVLGGGILPKIRDIFLASAFVDRFLDKGRMKDYVEPVPIKLIVQDGTALYGAASELLSN